MFSATFLGHQGWLVRTSNTALLLDPLLTERFGHGGGVGLVYPPRRVDPAACPPVDAVVITHEHDDHFDIPSLHRLDRRIPIHLSVRSSRAAHALLRDMGFVVHPLRPNTELAVGELRMRTFVADHRKTPASDEYDVFPFVLWDVHGHGGMACAVDVGMPDALVEALPRLVPVPGIWCHANNTTDVAFQELGPPCVAEDDTPALARVVLARHARIEQAWGGPVQALVCGGGWSFEGQRAWIDHHAFPFDSERLCATMRALHSAGSFAAPIPGDTLTLERGRVVSREQGGAFVRALPRAQWPSRTHEPGVPRPRDYAPACGRRRLSADQRARLLEHLEDYARYLYGSPLFRALCSLPLRVQGRASAWGFVIRDEQGTRCLLHDPSGCRFVEHDVGDPEQELLSGIECWGTDLLAFAEAEIGPSALCHAGRVRVWNHRPQQLRVTPHDLWMYGHPLRRPAAAAALYRSLWAREPHDVPRVPARG